MACVPGGRAWWVAGDAWRCFDDRLSMATAPRRGSNQRMTFDDRPGDADSAESARVSLSARLDRMERLLAGNERLGRVSQSMVGGRSRWPVIIAVVVAVGLQLVLPNRFAPGHRVVP